MRALRRFVFGISAEETRFERRGFRGGSPELRRHLDAIGQAFVSGYHAALDVARADRLAERLDPLDREMQGFAYEGAAMGLAVLDVVTPWRGGQWRALLAGAGAPHAYMVYIGAGWAAARLGGNVERFMKSDDDPVLRWLTLDGLGFHDGYFHWPRTIDAQRRPERLTGYALRVFDQGLGRSLWFVEGGEPARIARTIAGFEPVRQGDLWAGAGLAASYAGGIDRAGLTALRAAAGSYLPEVAQGAAFAAQARVRAANGTQRTDLACEILCGMPAREAAKLTEFARHDLTDENGTPAYEVWRRRIQNRFASESAVAHG